jgi:carboxypeptidase Q
MIGLGWSPAGDVTGEVEVVHSFEELKTKDVSGKIVCYNFVWTNYDETVLFRVMGPYFAE